MRKTKVKEYDESSDAGFLFWKRLKIKRIDGSPYLDRLIIIRCFLGAIMFHKIYATDTDCMHDHPWSFTTVIVKGGYWEHYMDRDVYDDPEYPHKQWIKPWTINYRPANWTHRLEIPEGKVAWSLVFTSPKKKSWGFLTPRGYVNWRLHPASNTCE